MEKKHHGYLLISSFTIALGIVSFALCIASEFKKTKRKDLKFDGGLCYLRSSHAYGLGIAALTCACVAQIIASLIICTNFFSGWKTRSCKAKRPTISGGCLFLSWISFGVAVVLISAASSMNRVQPYGKGWLDGECYIVKDGVFFGAGMLILVDLGLIIASAAVKIRKSQVEQDQMVHAQKQ